MTINYYGDLSWAHGFNDDMVNKVIKAINPDFEYTFRSFDLPDDLSEFEEVLGRKIRKDNDLTLDDFLILEKAFEDYAKTYPSWVWLDKDNNTVECDINPYMLFDAVWYQQIRW